MRRIKNNLISLIIKRFRSFRVFDRKREIIKSTMSWFQDVEIYLWISFAINEE
jgi:hypothetical protein